MNRYILILLIVTFVCDNIYTQHLFSVNYGDLSKDNTNRIRTEIESTSVSTMSITRNHNNKEVYALPLSSVQNTKIVILNEENGNSVVITPIEEATAHFEMAPFFIEELRRATLGDADRYLVIETDADFSVRSSASVSAASREVFIPRYFYGPKENVKEAIPQDREIVHIFKQKPRLIPAFPDDIDCMRYIANLEEEMSYYVYMYKLPDETMSIYDEHFNPSEDISNVRTIPWTWSRLQFDLSGTLNTNQRTATNYGLSLWREQLVGQVPVDINISFVYIDNPLVIGRSYNQPNFFNNGYHVPQFPNTWYSSSLWNQIVGYDATTLRDIRLEFNTNSTEFTFYFGLDGNTFDVDYVTVLLHEVTHGLGFSSLIYWDGTTQNNGRFVYTTSNGSGAYTNYPGIFDRQLYQGANGNINLTDLNQTQRAALVTSGNLFAGRPNSNLLTANGGNRVQMFAPDPWRGGSSVSHWDWSVTHFDNFMRHQYAFPLHTFNARKIGIMMDMGWLTICPTRNLIDEEITDETIITNRCGDIYVQDVEVYNNSHLELEATGRVRIERNFRVNPGSRLSIRNIH